MAPRKAEKLPSHKVPQPAVAFLARAVRDQSATMARHLATFESFATPESVHGVRVACRRMRALLSLFRPLVPAARPAADKLRALARGLAELRETDVFLQRLQATHKPEIQVLAARLAARRDELAADKSGTGTAGRAALLDLAAIAAMPGKGPGLAAYAPARLARLRRRFRKALHRARQQCNPADCHALRLRAKKLRYALECLHDHLGKPSRKAGLALQKMQQHLGDYLDARAAANALRGMTEFKDAAAGPVRDLARELQREARRVRADLPRWLADFEQTLWPAIKRALPRRKGRRT